MCPIGPTLAIPRSGDAAPLVTPKKGLLRRCSSKTPEMIARNVSFSPEAEALVDFPLDPLTLENMYEETKDLSREQLKEYNAGGET